MYVIKNKDGYMMRVVLFPATPPLIGMFAEQISIETATKYESKEAALEAILDLIIYNDEPASKFKDFTIEEIE